MAINSRMERCKPNPFELVRTLWDESTKNPVARAYTTGIIDALCWSDKITGDEHDRLSNWIESAPSVPESKVVL